MVKYPNESKNLMIKIKGIKELNAAKMPFEFYKTSPEYFLMKQNIYKKYTPCISYYAYIIITRNGWLAMLVMVLRMMVLAIQEIFAIYLSAM